MAFLSFLRISSLTGRTLVQIALGVTLIVALSSAVSYYLMYRQVKQRASEQLNHYVAQRAHSEEQIFLLARDTQDIIQRAVLDQYDSYSDGRSLARFDELYARQPDGSVRSRPETIGGRDPVTGWIHRDTPLTDELRRRMVLFHDVLEQFKPTSLMRFADIYFTSPEQINVGTDPPGVDRWAMSIEADFNQNAEQWVYFVDVAHNPKRATRWSDMYLDPVWKKLLVTVATPIDRADRHIGTIHNDLFLETLISNLLRSGIPGTKHCVFQADGHVIAHTDKIAQVRAAEGEYFIQASADPQLMSLLTAVQSAARWPVSGFDRDSDQYYAISRLAGPEWYFASTISGKFMRAQAFRAAQWVLWTGLSSLVLLLIALAAILRRQIARPLGDLTMAAERVAAGESLVALTAHRRDELGRLTDVFNDMTRKIDERDAALRADKRDLEAALRDVQKADEEIRAQRATLQQREHLAAMGTLLAGVAHELNNPLSVVVGRAVMLEESAQPQIQGTVRRIRLAAERCARIVKTYLAMARHHEPQRGRVQLNDIIEAALDVLEHTLHMSDVQIVRRMAADLPELNADPDQLHQVFMNLFFNAQQAMGEHPGPRTLTITTGRLETESAIQVLVADSGPGIPLEIRSRIFDPYFTTKPMGSGTGVGLAVSRGIIDAHGGSITVEGPPQGGTTFRIKLPLTDPVRIAVSDPIPERAAERLRILIAEDEHDVRETLGDILASENHDIELCASGADALQELATGDYDLIISDLRMPGMDGLTLFREIEARWPTLAQRVVFVTGDSLTPAIRRFLGDAGRPVIEKPFTPADVRGAVAEVTAGKRVHATPQGARAQDD